jgi:hypothetical protein
MHVRTPCADGERLWPSFVATLASGRGDVAARSQEIL